MPALTRRTLLAGTAVAGAAGVLPRTLETSYAAERAHGSMHADVVVVGAGLAGLSAARAFAGRGLDVVLLEARERVGGRTLNHAIDSHHVVEVGGQWFGPEHSSPAGPPTDPAWPANGAVEGQSHVWALARAVGLGTFATYNTGSYVDYRGGAAHTYNGRIPTDTPTGAVEAGEALVAVDQRALTVPTDKPWTAAHATEWDSMTVQSWMDHGDTFGAAPGEAPYAFAGLKTSDGRQLFELAVEAVFSAEPRDISMLHLLFYVHAAGSIGSLINTDKGAQMYRVRGGSQLVSLRVAHHLGDRVRLSSPVRRIEQSARAVVVSGDGFRVRAARVVVAVPPTLAGRIDYAPALPALRDQLTQRFPMGTVLKVQCVYDEPFWRADGLAGQATSDTGPVKVTFDNSPPEATATRGPGVMMGFIEGADGRAALRMSTAQRRKAVIGSFVRYFGPKAEAARAYVEKSWADEQWSRGCYGGYLPTGGWLDYGPVLRAPVGRIHWAGTETATEWMGYMDGAVRSGERAASEVLSALRR